MKIETSQRDTIFAQLKRKGKWSARRNGHNVTIWVRPSPEGTRVHYQVTRRHLNVVGPGCATVTAAIEAVNRVLEPSETKFSAPVQSMPLSAPVRDQRLPYADN